ncbi:MAG: hypothetical protein ACE5HQ_13980 [Gemmatimonadota bacterium]
MRSYIGYCSRCDSRVLVRLDPEAELPADPVEIRCLDRVASCEQAECPLAGVSPADLRDRLEFLPATLAGGEPRSLEEAAEILRRARAASVRREVDRAGGKRSGD